MNVSRSSAEHERLIGMLEPAVGRLAARGILRSYRKNTILLNEGEPGDSLFVLLQGQVKVYATDENGREITYGTIVTGDYFGEMSLLDVYGRVIHTLESEQGPAAVQAPVQLTQITHQQIASRVGASREMVSRLLKDLEKGGYVELGVKRITLKKKLPARW
jgi:CRP/FNR family cyclic AMP-dependent transcriptional regulator